MALATHGDPHEHPAALRAVGLGSLLLAFGTACYESYFVLAGEDGRTHDDAATRPDADARDDAGPVPEDAAENEDVGPGPVDILTIAQAGPPRVDLLVVVDNSGSMFEEQAALTLRFPELIRDLLFPADRDGDTRPDHGAVQDLNLGVISTDLGSGGYFLPNCIDDPLGGDQGCLQHTPSPAVAGCEPSYPLFLSWNETTSGTYTPEELAQDFACIGTLGVEGCFAEQPLKALRKAVTTATEPGDCNEGFLRPDAQLAVIFVTDEDDCSISPDHPEMFDRDRADLGDLNVRCVLHRELLVGVNEYAEAFEELTAGKPGGLVIGMIVGVPPDTSSCIGPGDTLETCLEEPAMEERIEPGYPPMLYPSCNTAMGVAYPARRFVSLAQRLGRSAYVDSICKSDWTDVLLGFGERVTAPSIAACAPRSLPFDRGTCQADCVMIETLSDDRPCMVDPGCPPEACPAATEAEAFDPPPCTAPGTGARCVPLERDLGTAWGADGGLHRLCLLRQATRDPEDDCGSRTLDDGWFYLPRDSSLHDCPEVVFGHGDGSLIDLYSTAVVRCLD